MDLFATVYCFHILKYGVALYKVYKYAVYFIAKFSGVTVLAQSTRHFTGEIWYMKNPGRTSQVIYRFQSHIYRLLSLCHSLPILTLLELWETAIKVVATYIIPALPNPYHLYHSRNILSRTCTSQTYRSQSLLSVSFFVNYCSTGHINLHHFLAYLSLI